MKNAKLFVCERTGEWARAWKRVASPGEFPLVELRSLADLTDELAKFPHSVAAVATAIEPATMVLEWLFRARESFPQARFLVMANAGERAAEVEWRAAGAALVVYGQLDLPAAGWVALRHLERAPEIETSFAQKITDSLPWRRFASPSAMPLHPQDPQE